MRKFIVQNTSSQNKKVIIFGLGIEPGFSYDLMKLPNVTENAILDSLESGVLRNKLLNGDLTVVTSTVLVPSGDPLFTEFLTKVGLGKKIAPSVCEDYLTRSNWYIDSVLGDDNNSGDATNKALKTFAEWQKRVGDFTTLTPTELFLNINILNDLPASDPVTFRNIIGRGHSCFINGSEKVLATGTLTGTTDKDRSTNTPWQVTTAVDLSAHIGKKIVITSGQGAGSGAYILRDMGSNTLHVSEWMSEDTFFDSGTYQSEPPTTGSGYKIVDYTAVSVGATQVGYESTIGVYDPDLDYWAPVGGLVLRNLHLQTDAENIPFESGVTHCSFPKPLFSTETPGGFAHCIIDCPSTIPAGSINAGAANVLFRGEVGVASGAYFLQFGGAYLPGIYSDYPGGLRIERGGYAHLGADVAFVGTPGHGADLQTLGVLQSGPLNFWDSHHTVFPLTGGEVVMDPEDAAGDGSLIDYHLWGTGNDNVPVFFQGSSFTIYQFKWDDGYTPTYPTIEWGIGEPVFDGYIGYLGGDGGTSNPNMDPTSGAGYLSTAYAFNGATGAFTGPRYLTWDNMATAVGSGGFMIRDITWPADGGGQNANRLSIATDPTRAIFLTFAFDAHVP